MTASPSALEVLKKAVEWAIEQDMCVVCMADCSYGRFPKIDTHTPTCWVGQAELLLAGSEKKP